MGQRGYRRDGLELCLGEFKINRWRSTQKSEGSKDKNGDLDGWLVG